MAKGKKVEESAVVTSEATTTISESPKEQKVEVSREFLDTILRELKDVKEAQAQYEQTATQDQIRKIEALRASGKLVKSVKLRRFENKLVIGWKIIEDKVWVQDGKLNEVQTVKIFFDDMSNVDTTLLNFTRGTLYEPYEVIRESRLGNGDTEFTVMLDGGKEVVINSKYVN